LIADRQIAVAHDNRAAFATTKGRVESGRRIDNESPPGDHTDVDAVAFSPDDRTVASTGLDKRIVLWGSGGGPSRVFEAPSGVSMLVFSSDGAFLRGTGWAIDAWNVATGERTSLDRPLWRVASELAFVDGNRLAFSDDSGDVHIWAPTTGDVHTLRGHRTSVETIAASDDGRTLATVADREVRVWAVPPRRRVAQLRGTATGHPLVSSDCRLVASGDSNGNVTVWNTVTDEVFTLSGHTTWVNAISFAPDNTHLVSTDYTSMQLWDLQTKQGREIRRSSAGQLKSSRYLPDGRLIVIDNDELLVLGSDNTTPTCRAPGGLFRVSADGRKLAIHREGTISIVELPSCRVREVARKSEPTWIGLSPDGTQLAMVGGESGQSELLDLARGTVRPLEGREIGALDYSSNGALLAVAGRTGTIQVWDTATGELRRQFVGHKGSVGRAKFSPDSTLLASIDVVGALRVWSIDGDHREVHYGHASNVMGLAFCARGDFMVSSGFDGTLRLWSTTPARPRPADPVGLSAWLDTVTTAQAVAEGGLASPPR
jgi:WD40 repeat protein